MVSPECDGMALVALGPSSSFVSRDPQGILKGSSWDTWAQMGASRHGLLFWSQRRPGFKSRTKGLLLGSGGSVASRKPRLAHHSPLFGGTKEHISTHTESTRRTFEPPATKSGPFRARCPMAARCHWGAGGGTRGSMQRHHPKQAHVQLALRLPLLTQVGYAMIRDDQFVSYLNPPNNGGRFIVS